MNSFLAFLQCLFQCLKLGPGGLARWEPCQCLWKDRLIREEVRHMFSPLPPSLHLSLYPSACLPLAFNETHRPALLYLPWMKGEREREMGEIVGGSGKEGGREREGESERERRLASDFTNTGYTAVPAQCLLQHIKESNAR